MRGKEFLLSLQLSIRCFYNYYILYTQHIHQMYKVKMKIAKRQIRMDRKLKTHLINRKIARFDCFWRLVLLWNVSHELLIYIGLVLFFTVCLLAKSWESCFRLSINFIMHKFYNICSLKTYVHLLSIWYAVNGERLLLNHFFSSHRNWKNFDSYDWTISDHVLCFMLSVMM